MIIDVKRRDGETDAVYRDFYDLQCDIAKFVSDDKLEILFSRLSKTRDSIAKAYVSSVEYIKHLESEIKNYQHLLYKQARKK